MRDSLKAAVAATAGAVLLLGGADTLAFWSAGEDVDGGHLSSGEFRLSAPTCAGGATHDWQLDDGTPYVAGTTLLVPGDTLTKVCDLTLTMTGSHVGATLGIGAPVLSADPLTTFDDELTASAAFSVDGAPATAVTGAGTYAIRATITVAFDPTADNGSQLGDVDLDAVQVSAVQTHG